MDINELKQFAMAGDAEAMNSYGATFYNKGDYVTAEKWYQKAAAAGSHWALNNLGYVYAYGRTGKVDKEQAFYYFTQASMMGNVQATYKIGDFYYYGDFVKQNKNVAFLYYQQAAFMNEDEDDIISDIHYRLARAYFYGAGIKADDFEALKHINIAETASYEDRFANKFRWEGLAKKIILLKQDIITSLDQQYHKLHDIDIS